MAHSLPSCDSSIDVNVAVSEVSATLIGGDGSGAEPATAETGLPGVGTEFRTEGDADPDVP